MKRLTKCENGRKSFDCYGCEKLGGDCDPGDCNNQAISRLESIEGVLGPTYDLTRIKELVEADREGRFTEVVRCKDCKYYYKIPMSIPVCILSDHKFRKPDDFCSYGKREAAEKVLEDMNA